MFILTSASNKQLRLVKNIIRKGRRKVKPFNFSIIRFKYKNQKPWRCCKATRPKQNEKETRNEVKVSTITFLDVIVLGDTILKKLGQKNKKINKKCFRACVKNTNEERQSSYLSCCNCSERHNFVKIWR